MSAARSKYSGPSRFDLADIDHALNRHLLLAAMAEAIQADNKLLIARYITLSDMDDEVAQCESQLGLDVLVGAGRLRAANNKVARFTFNADQKATLGLAGLKAAAQKCRVQVEKMVAAGTARLLQLKVERAAYSSETAMIKENEDQGMHNVVIA